MSVTPMKDMINLPEHGRIRTGIKSGRGMKALGTFRLTSVDRGALEELASEYGGEVKAWSDKKANPPNQFELITESDTIHVVVQPDSIDSNYELWSGGGRLRVCDGETCQVTVTSRDGQGYEEQSCICHAQGMVECRPKTRMNVMFPSIKFAGTWRYESSGQSAARTLRSMLQIIDTLQSVSGLLPVEMVLVPQQKVVAGQTRKFTVVQLRPGVSMKDMLTGAGTFQAQIQSGSTVIQPSPALPTSSTTSTSTESPPSSTTKSHEPPPTSTTERLSDSKAEPGPSTPTSPTKPSSTPPTPSAADSEISSTESQDISDPDDEIVDAELVEDEPDWPVTGLKRDEAMRLAREHDRVIKKVDKTWTVA